MCMFCWDLKTVSCRACMRVCVQNKMKRHAYTPKLVSNQQATQPYITQARAQWEEKVGVTHQIFGCKQKRGGILVLCTKFSQL